MAKVIRREFYNVKGSDVFKITPLGDIHLGSASCDEKSFKAKVKEIQEEDNHYWIGLGDYCEFINRSDPRFDVANLADWLIKKSALSDIAKAEREYFLDIIEPISHKCLGLVMGNHEKSIIKYYERDIYFEIVTSIKEMGKFPSDHQLSFGYYGWLILGFYRDQKKKQGSHNITINLHHGFVGGKLAGAKALNMQRWLWSHDCDIVIFGHSHNEGSQTEAVEYVDQAGNIKIKPRKGMYAGTFLRSTNDNGGASSYSEEKGYFPLAHSVIPYITLKPQTKVEHERIKITT